MNGSDGASPRRDGPGRDFPTLARDLIFAFFSKPEPASPTQRWRPASRSRWMRRKGNGLELTSRLSNPTRDQTVAEMRLQSLPERRNSASRTMFHLDK